MSQLTELLEDYRNGYLVSDAQAQLARGFVLTGLFPKTEVTGKTINVVDSTPLDRFVDKTGEMRKIAKGARARRIIGEVKTAQGLKLTHNEIEYIIETEDLETEGFDINEEIGAMAYILSQDVEAAVYTAAASNAQLTSSTGVTANWDDAGSTLEDILNDIVQFQSDARLTRYRLNWFAYGTSAHTYFLKKSQASLEDYTIPQNQFTLDDTVSMSNARHFFGGSEMSAGEILGGDLNNPGLRVFYKKFTNPNVKAAPLPAGMEMFAPAIKMLVYDNAETKTEPQTVIKVACAVGAYPRNEGAGLFRYADITA